MILNLKEIYNDLEINKKLNKNFIFEKFSIDSRNINHKSLFIPLKGKNFDGHNYIDSVADKGVMFSLVEKNKKHLVKNKEINLIEVSDTYDSLIKLAKYAKKKINKLKVICITGSSGKTTVKEWLTRILKIVLLFTLIQETLTTTSECHLLSKYSKENRNMYFRIRYE